MRYSQDDKQQTVVSRFNELRKPDFVHIVDGCFLLSCSDDNLEKIAYELFKAKDDDDSNIIGIVSPFHGSFGFLNTEVGKWLKKQLRKQHSDTEIRSYEPGWAPGGPSISV